MVQETVREVKAELTAAHADAKEKQGDEAITVLSRWKIIKRTIHYRIRVAPFVYLQSKICKKQWK